MRQWILAFACLLAAVVGAAGQTPADLCRMEGTVRNAVPGQPVRKALISLTPAAGGEPIVAVTDSIGRYALANVAPGAYKLTAAHEGYLSQSYGAKKPGEDQKSEPLELTAGSSQSGVDLRLTPLASILGHVRDEDGDPIRQVSVAALAYGYSPSGKSLQVRAAAQTDALGEFRLFDLPPGTYYLRARPISAQMPGFAQTGQAYDTVFYPNALQSAGAGSIDLAAGEEHRDADFVLRTTTVSFIHGHVVKPPGGEHCSAGLEAGADDALPVSGGVMFISKLEGSDNDFGSLLGGKSADSDGRFKFRDVPVGSHTLTASCTVGKQTYTSKTPLELGPEGLENVELRPVGPSTVTARLGQEGEPHSKLSDTQVQISGGANEITPTLDGEGQPEVDEPKSAQDVAFFFQI